MELKINKPFDGDFPVTFEFGADPEWYVSKIGYPHNGVDNALPEGTLVFACDEGTVIRKDYHPRGWGKFVRVQHDWGISHYAHLKEHMVEVGEKVNSDIPVGVSGKTGWVTGPHLHFGIKVFGVENPEMKHWVDPVPYFKGEDVVDSITCPYCGRVIVLEDKKDG